MKQNIYAIIAIALGVFCFIDLPRLRTFPSEFNYIAATVGIFLTVKAFMKKEDTTLSLLGAVLTVGWLLVHKLSSSIDDLANAVIYK
jgi:hypothetical protein